MRPELKIVADVLRYRLGRLEMANLVGAVAIMWALQLDLAEVAVRFVFGALLNVLVYLNNDYCDREVDVEAAGRDRGKAEFLRDHSAAAVRAQLVLVAFLAVLGVKIGLLWVGVLGGGICWAYSAHLKRHAGVDVLAMMAWGIAMPLVAVPDGDSDGWRLVLQLGLFSGVFETLQVLRDHDEDAARGTRTTAVALGPERTRWLVRALIAASAVYAGIAFSPWLGASALLALFVPLTTDVQRDWTRIRLLLGPVFLIECALVRWQGLW